MLLNTVLSSKIQTSKTWYNFSLIPMRFLPEKCPCVKEGRIWGGSDFAVCENLISLIVHRW